MTLDELFKRAEKEAQARGDEYISITLTGYPGDFWDSAEITGWKATGQRIDGVIGAEMMSKVQTYHNFIGGGGSAAGALECCLEDVISAQVGPEVEGATRYRPQEAPIMTPSLPQEPRNVSEGYIDRDDNLKRALEAVMARDYVTLRRILGDAAYTRWERAILGPQGI